MNSKRGIIGMFFAMFVATIFIVMILLIMIVGSGFVKKIQEKDNFGVQNETVTGIDDVLDYMDVQFNNMTQLRIIVEKGGDWEGWLTEEMRYDSSDLTSKGENVFRFLKDESIFIVIGSGSLAEQHTITLTDFSEEGTVWLIESFGIVANLDPGEVRYIDTNYDGFFDIKFTSLALVKGESATSKIEKVRSIPVDYDVGSLEKYLRDNKGVAGNTERYKIMQRYYNEAIKNGALPRNEVYVNGGDAVKENVFVSASKTGNKHTDWYLEEYEKKRVSPDFVGNELFDNLPWREWYVRTDTKKNIEGLEYYKSGEFGSGQGDSYGVPCGAEVLHMAFFYLGKDVEIRDIIAKKQGGFMRGFLSIFTHAAVHITWPHEIEEIAEYYGFDVERIKGKNATLETAARKSTENSVVIVRFGTGLKFMGIIRAQHLAVYDTNMAKVHYEHWYDTNLPTHESDKIHELFVIKKRGFVV